MAGTWLGGMDLYLRRPGYAAREIIAGVILGQAVLTVLSLTTRASAILKPLALAGCLVIAYIAASALIAAEASVAVHGAHLEGYVLLIALTLLLQATLTLGTLPASKYNSDPGR